MIHLEYSEVYAKTKDIIVDYLGVDENEVEAETDIVEELCVDSIALVELGFRFSETFGIPMVENNMDLYVMKNLVDFIYDSIE
ncbi:MAG: acyl carrier protein [Halanaerobiales bacterium]